MENHHGEEKITRLCRLIAGITNEEEIRLLLDDLCTVKELENMAERLYAAELILQGNTYNQVMSQVKMSSATLSRVSRCVQYGKGYRQVLQK